MDYSPFTKPVDALTAADFSCLRDVREGWFVEYKRAIVSGAAAAKSVSALANTRGGWLFYGIDAPSASVGCATSFPGIPKQDLPSLLQRIRDGVTAHLSPSPFFEIKVVDGPSPELSLLDDRSLIAIHVPSGRRPPYLHTSGVVYVRVGDKSDPVRENDRTRLEELFERARRSKERIDRLLARTPLGWEQEPFVQIFALPDPHRERRWLHEIDFQRFTQIMNPEYQPTKLQTETDLSHAMAMPFPIAQTAKGEFIARQANPGLLHSLTWRFSRYGESTISLPLSTRTVRSAADITAYLDGYKHAEAFVAAWEHAKVGECRIVDFTLACAVMGIVFTRVHDLIDACRFEGFTGKIFSKIILYNVGNVLPFIDTPPFVEHVSKFGLPVVQDDVISLPGDERDDFMALGPWKSVPGFTDAWILSLAVANGLGLPWADQAIASESMEEHMSSTWQPWLESVDTAIQVQRRRSASPG